MLSGRTAVVTGGQLRDRAGHGRALSGAGATVVLMARDARTRSVAAAESAATPSRGSFAIARRWTRAADAAARLAGEPDILVNAAGDQPAAAAWTT